MEIDLLTYSPKYSNKQKLIFTVLNKDNDIKFEIDGLILKNQNKEKILNGWCLHPDYKVNSKLKDKLKFYHNIYQIIKQYPNRTELRKFNNSLYALIIYNKWDDIFKDYSLLRENWTKEKCHKIALTCKTKIEFSIKYNKAYKYAWYNNILNEVCLHMQKLRDSWSYENCLNVALTCKSKIEFYNKNTNAYKAAIKNNWLDEICAHMISLNQLNFPRLIYSYEFKDKSIYIGLTKNFKKRHYHRIYKNNDCVMQHIKLTKLQPKIKFLTDFIPAYEAQLKEQEFIDKYKNLGYKILNKYKAGSLGGHIF